MASSFGQNFTLIQRPKRYAAHVQPFAPTDLSNLVAWWDASNSGSITETGGDISQWNDLSGNGHHATAPSLYPTLTTFNSHSAIRFNPAGTQHFDIATLDMSGGPYTSFVAVKFSGSTISIGSVSGYNASLYYDGISGVMYWTGQGSVPRTNSGVSTNASLGNVVTTQITDGSNALIRVDGAAQTISDPPGSTAAFDAIGQGWGGQYSNCYLFEILLYSDAKNTTDIAQVEAYLKAKWGTP